jgi:hypothetical protein
VDDSSEVRPAQPVDAIWIRLPHLSSRTAVVVDPIATGLRADWIVSENTIDRFGRIVSRGGGLDFNYLAARCPAVAAAGPFGVKGSGGVDACVRSLGLRTAVAFQPAARFWTFQWIEFGVYMGLALALAAFVSWRVKRLWLALALAAFVIWRVKRLS